MKESIKKPLVSNRIGWILVGPQCYTLYPFADVTLNISRKTPKKIQHQVVLYATNGTQVPEIYWYIIPVTELCVCQA